MKRTQSSSIQGSTGLLVVALIGLLVAGGTFLATFITTQKAKTPNPRVNLRIPVPSIPARRPLETLPVVIQPSPIITPETEVPVGATEAALPPVESTPSATEESPVPQL